MGQAVAQVIRKCGHREMVDVSDKKPRNRESYAKWLEKQVCKDCFIKAKKAENKKEWLLEQKKMILDDEQRLALPKLEGSEKQVGWGRQVRVKILRAAYEELVEAGELSDTEFDNQIIDPALQVVKASWWIDEREEPATTLAERLKTALEDGSLSDTENPY